MSFDLAAAAGKFGDELQQLLDAVLPYEEGADPELRQVTVTASRLAFAIELGTAKAKEAKTTPLLHQRRKVADLFIMIRLVADSAERYPAVAKSKFELRVDRHPLLRLDFDRDMHTAPGCHWNVHAERGAITNLLARNNPVGCCATAAESATTNDTPTTTKRSCCGRPSRPRPGNWPARRPPCRLIPGEADPAP